MENKTILSLSLLALLLALLVLFSSVLAFSTSNLGNIDVVGTATFRNASSVVGNNLTFADANTGTCYAGCDNSSIFWNGTGLVIRVN